MTERFEIVEKAIISMLESKQYAAVRQVLVTMNPADIAEIFSELLRSRDCVFSDLSRTSMLR